MIKKVIHIQLILFIFFASCQNSNTAGHLESDAAQLGALQCTAKDLRTQRFQLADKIRFAEDSLLRFKKPLNPMQTKQLDSLKDVLTLKTDLISRRIVKHLDSLWKNGYEKEGARQQLDAAISQWVQKNCPNK